MQCHFQKPYLKILPKEHPEVFCYPHHPILLNVLVQWGQWEHTPEGASRALQRDQRWMGDTSLTVPLKYSICRRVLPWGRNRKLALHDNLLRPHCRIMKTMGGVRLHVSQSCKFVCHRWGSVLWRYGLLPSHTSALVSYIMLVSTSSLAYLISW